MKTSAGGVINVRGWRIFGEVDKGGVMLAYFRTRGMTYDGGLFSGLDFC